MKNITIIAAAAAVILTTNARGQADIGSAEHEQREQLFEWIITATMQRESFSPIKNENLGIDIEESMRACRNDVLSADTDVDLYFALVKLSAARKDRHLKVRMVEDGLDPLPPFEELAREIGRDSYQELTAPISLRAGFADPRQPTIFIVDLADVAYNVAGIAPKAGDELTNINGMSIRDYVKKAGPYWRYSTPANLWMNLAIQIPKFNMNLPPWFYESILRLGFRRDDGSTYELTLEYMNEAEFAWQGLDQRRYPGFKRVTDRESFDIYRPTDNRSVILIQWYWFGDDLIEAVDELVELARDHNWFEYDLIIDCTRARGGSRGAYAVQRLTSKPFKTTFGNVRMSDVIPLFVQDRIASYAEGRRVMDGSSRESVDDGSWAIDWLVNDVLKGYREGQEYSNNVPFKCAHAPKYSDGILHPAADHFRGRLVCWFGPQGGSHLDQFASIVVDNNLGYTIGMPTGGYSNTWEWEETIKMPGTDRPLLSFMWSIGHTIRPNGQILEGNPAEIDQWLPPTPSNAGTYTELLLKHSLEWLDAHSSRGNQ